MSTVCSWQLNGSEPMTMEQSDKLKLIRQIEA
jgi:hypothetical protein